MRVRFLTADDRETRAVRLPESRETTSDQLGVRTNMHDLVGVEPSYFRATRGAFGDFPKGPRDGESSAEVVPPPFRSRFLPGEHGEPSEPWSWKGLV